MLRWPPTRVDASNPQYTVIVGIERFFFRSTQSFFYLRTVVVGSGFRKPAAISVRDEWKPLTCTLRCVALGPENTMIFIDIHVYDTDYYGHLAIARVRIARVRCAFPSVGHCIVSVGVFSRPRSRCLSKCNPVRCCATAALSLPHHRQTTHAWCFIMFLRHAPPCGIKSTASLLLNYAPLVIRFTYLPRAC